MSSYLVLDIAVEDAETYKEYVSRAPAIVAARGGRYLVRGGNPTTVEGDWSCSRFVILEFPDRAHVEAFVNAPEYAELRAMRLKSTRSRTLIVDGFTPA